MEVVVEASLLKWFGAEVARFARRFAQNTRSLKWLASLGASRKTLRVMWFGPRCGSLRSALGAEHYISDVTP